MEVCKPSNGEIINYRTYIARINATAAFVLTPNVISGRCLGDASYSVYKVCRRSGFRYKSNRKKWGIVRNLCELWSRNE